MFECRESLNSIQRFMIGFSSHIRVIFKSGICKPGITCISVIKILTGLKVVCSLETYMC